MLYQSPADFCAGYAEAHAVPRTDQFGGRSQLDTVTLVSETPDAARVEVLWFTDGHAPDSGYYDVYERTAFNLVRRDDGWHVDSEEDLGYE